MACSCLPLCRRSAASGDVYVRRCALYLLACVLSLAALVDLDEDGGLNVRWGLMMRWDCASARRAVLTLWLHADVEFLKSSAQHDADAAVRELCVGCLGQLQRKLKDDSDQ